MGNKHVSSRRDHFRPRDHDLATRPRPYPTSEGARIDLFGGGIIKSPKPLTPDASGTIRSNPSGESFTPRPGNSEKR